MAARLQAHRLCSGGGFGCTQHGLPRQRAHLPVLTQDLRFPQLLRFPGCAGLVPRHSTLFR